MPKIKEFYSVELPIFYKSSASGYCRQRGRPTITYKRAYLSELSEGQFLRFVNIFKIRKPTPQTTFAKILSFVRRTQYWTPSELLLIRQKEEEYAMLYSEAFLSSLSDRDFFLFIRLFKESQKIMLNRFAQIWDEDLSTTPGPHAVQHQECQYNSPKESEKTPPLSPVELIH